MFYENAEYRRGADGSAKSVRVVIDGVPSVVPADPDNRHYAAMLAQVAAGSLHIAEPAEDLPALKERLKVAIDAAAEGERLKHITDGAGQAMVYREKAEEAAAFLNDPDPEPGRYPILEASLGIEAASLAAIATMVIARREAWTHLAAAIEAARLGAKAAIDAATDAPAAAAAFDAVVWPS